jgi:hypothetical protein
MLPILHPRSGAYVRTPFSLSTGSMESDRMESSIPSRQWVASCKMENSVLNYIISLPDLNIYKMYALPQEIGRRCPQASTCCCLSFYMISISCIAEAAHSVLTARLNGDRHRKRSRVARPADPLHSTCCWHESDFDMLIALTIIDWLGFRVNKQAKSGRPYPAGN